MNPISTSRLKLIPLSREQLISGLESLNSLSAKLGVPVVESLFDGLVHRAVTMKIEKMRLADKKLHVWYTYWLIVVIEENIGIGMVGFKGVPDEQGKVEIGYGIDPIFQRRGYMSEAAGALIAWAFSHPQCRTITATNIRLDNFASQKVLQRNCFVEVRQDEHGISYRLDKS